MKSCWLGGSTIHGCGLGGIGIGVFISATVVGTVAVGDTFFGGFGMAATFTQEARANLWDLIAGTGGSLLYVRLFKNNVTITQATLITDLIQCDYNGYTELNSSTWIGPAVDTNGDEIMTSPIFVFQHGPVNDSQQAFGYYVIFKVAGNAKMLCAENFATPYTMNSIVNQVPVPVVLRLRQLSA
jgi:hypothetical protein